MALPKQHIPVPIGKGLDQSNHEKTVAPPHLLKADDVRITKGGQLAKRYGYTDLSTTGLASSSFGGGTYTLGQSAGPEEEVTCTGKAGTLFDHRGQLGMVTSEGVYTYDSQESKWTRPTTHSLYNIDCEVTPIAAADRVSSNPDIAVGNNVIAVVWEESEVEDVFIAFFDATTYTQLYPPQKVSDGILPRIVFFNQDYFGVFYRVASGTSSDLEMRVYQESAGDYTLGSATTINIGGGVSNYDVHANSSASFCVVGYDQGSGVVEIETRSSAGALLNSRSFVSGSNRSKPAVFHDDTNSVIVWAVSDATSSPADEEAYLRDESLSGGSEVQVDILAGSDKESWFTNFRKSIRRINDSRYAFLFSSTGANMASASADTIWGVQLVNTNLSLVVQEHFYLPSTSLLSSALNVTDAACGLVFATHNEIAQISGPTELQSTAQPYPAGFLCRAGVRDDGEHDLHVMSRFMANPSKANVSSAATFDEFNHISTLVLGNQSEVLGVFTEVLESNTDSGIARSRIVLAKWDFPQPRQRRCLRTATGIAVGAGTVGIFDGSRGAEVSPHWAPVIFDLETTTGSGIGDATDTDVDFTLVAVWTDAYGRVHRSAPSTIATSSTGAKHENVLIDYALPYSALNGDLSNSLRVEVYQSAAYDPTAASVGATARYRTNLMVPERKTGDEALYSLSLDVSPSGSEGTLYAIPSAVGVQDYVQAGELSSDPTLHPVDIAVGAGRVFYIPPTKDRVLFSKPQSLTYSWEFNDTLEIIVPAFGGTCEALAFLEDKLVIFKEDCIYVTSVSGGPDANGSGADFPTPRLVPSDTGCSNPQSVVTGPFGVVFESRRGIYLLGRDLSVSFIGAAVQDETEDTSVVSATWVPKATEIRFHLDNGTANSYKEAVVWNYERDAWTVHTKLPSVSSWMSSSDYYVADTDLTVSKEDEATWEHASVADELVIDFETPWFHLDGIPGFHRLYRINIEGHWYQGGSLKVEIYNDYDGATVQDTFTFVTGVELDASSDQQLELRLPPSYQKCKALKVRVYQYFRGGEPFFPDNEGAGFELHGISLEVGVKNGGYKLINTYTGN